jgi:thioredoxin 1
MMSLAAATTEATFQKDVLESPLPVLVDFWASWCAPCRMIAPTLDAISKELEGRLRVYKVDVDANPNLANRYGVQGIPTLILFSAGEARGQVVGVRSKDALLAEIERSVGVKP